MAKAQQLGPTDVAGAFIDGGNLTIVDGRGIPWVYQPGQKDPNGKELIGPDGADQAFVINERLHVLSGGVVWTYYPGQEGWVEGFELDNKKEGDEDGPWLKGRSIESRVAVPDELRRAQATIEAADAAQEAEDERGSGGKSKRKAKEKEHA